MNWWTSRRVCPCRDERVQLTTIAGQSHCVQPPSRYRSHTQRRVGGTVKGGVGPAWKDRVSSCPSLATLLAELQSEG